MLSSKLCRSLPLETPRLANAVAIPYRFDQATPDAVVYKKLASQLALAKAEVPLWEQGAHEGEGHPSCSASLLASPLGCQRGSSPGRALRENLTVPV